MKDDPIEGWMTDENGDTFFVMFDTLPGHIQDEMWGWQFYYESDDEMYEDVLYIEWVVQIPGGWLIGTLNGTVKVEVI